MARIDLSDLPSNTLYSREHSSLEASNPETTKVSAVASGAKIRETGKIQKAVGLFISEENRNTITGAITKELKKTVSNLVTNTADAIRNILTDGVDILLYGEPTKKSSAETSSFRKYWGDDIKKDSSSSASKVSSSALVFGDVCVPSRAEGKKILVELEDCLEKYPVVTVADLYQAAGILEYPHTANKYGWTDIKDAKIVESKDGFYVSMPKPKALEKEN